MNKLKETYNYSPLSLNKRLNKQFEDTKKYVSDYKMLSNELVGIEIEVENIPHSIGNFIEYYWKETEDGSLRNYGREYVSQPLRGDQVGIALQYLNDKLPPNREFSPRTSVHVHLNVRELTQDQLYMLVILYAIYEHHFFKSVHPKRINSLFCVPLYQSNLMRCVKDIIYKGYSSWSKYAALNLLPIVYNDKGKPYGTIEFRHIHGTVNCEVILPFINSIYALYNFVKKANLEDVHDFLVSANSTSGYISMYHQIFGTLINPNIQSSELETCISMTKKNLFYDKLSNLLSTTDKQLRYYNI